MKRIAFALALLLITPALFADDVLYRFRLSVDGNSYSLTDADGSGAWRPAYASTGAGGEVWFSDDAIAAGNPRCMKAQDGEQVALRVKSYETTLLRCLEADCAVRVDGGEPIAAPRGQMIDVPSHAVLEIRLTTPAKAQ